MLTGLLVLTATVHATDLGRFYLSQDQEFMEFYKDDEKIQAHYRMLEALCRAEDALVQKISEPVRLPAVPPWPERE